MYGPVQNYNCLLSDRSGHIQKQNMTTSLDDQAPEDSTGAPEQMSSTRGMFPLGPVPERLF